MRRRRLAIQLALIAGVAITPAGAQPQLTHLRIIAPAAPGGGWDQTARAMQQVLQTQALVSSASVENIPGAAGTIGLARLIGAERGQGGVVMVSGLIMLGAIRSHGSPVTLNDVTPIARLTGEYEVIVVPAASPYRTLTALLEALRVRPESIAWAGGSAGGTDQILAGLIADAIGVSPRRVNYVAFAGGGESLAAILGGQVTAGISGLGEYAAQIATGAVRVLAISSAERVPGVAAPTLREQGVDVVLENWRSLMGPPGLTSHDRERLERVVAAMVGSPAWQQARGRYGWTDRYLAGPAFREFLADEDARVDRILAKLGATAATNAGSEVGRYPIFVLSGLAACLIAFTWTAVGSHRRLETSPHAGAEIRSHRALVILVIAAATNVLLVERLGFVLSSTALFWLAARAFDPRHPGRDAVAAVVLSLAAYGLFTQLLQVSLPAGVIAPWR